MHSAAGLSFRWKGLHPQEEDGDMNVTIVGPGNMGRGIATRLLTGEHRVAVTGRDPQKSAALARELSPAGGVAAPSGVEEAVRDAEVVILALPYPGSLDFARDHGRALDGKLVVDISNPLNETYSGLVTGGDTSAAETIRGLLPAGVRLVKAFNTTFAPTLLEGAVAGEPLDVFIASDDDPAVATVAELVRTSGMRPIRVGPLERARQLEAMAFLGIAAQEPLGTNFRTGWKMLLPK